MECGTMKFTLSCLQMSNQELIQAFKDAVVTDADCSQLEKELLTRLEFNIPKWQLFALCNNAQQQHEHYQRLISQLE